MSGLTVAARGSRFEKAAFLASPNAIAAGSLLVALHAALLTPFAAFPRLLRTDLAHLGWTRTSYIENQRRALAPVPQGHTFRADVLGRLNFDLGTPCLDGHLLPSYSPYRVVFCLAGSSVNVDHRDEVIV